MYDIAKYEEARTVQEAISLLQQHPQARLIAGGSDLLLKIREGKIPGAELISIHGMPELQGISLDVAGTIRIGSGSSFSQIANHPIIQARIPVLGQAVSRVGGPQIRNIGTIGGNICNGVTSADSASTLFALNARLIIQGDTGVREALIQEFYLGPGRVDLRHDEVLTAVLITRDNYEGFGGCYIKFAMRSAMDIATLGCTAVCKLKDHRIVEDFRLALGVAAPVPIRCPRTEELVRGRVYSEELVREAGRSALSEVNPRTSWRASREYRLQLVEELCRRAFRQAYLKAGGEQ